MFIVDLGVSSYYSLLGVSTDADVKEIRGSASKIFNNLEQQRLKERDPEEIRNIVQRQKNINKISGELTNAAARAKYDAQNVHLTFFAVRKAVAPLWQERARLLRWMHDSLRDFLAQRGEAVEPVTDLERSDFTSDFTRNELLERLLQNAERGDLE